MFTVIVFAVVLYSANFIINRIENYVMEGASNEDWMKWLSLQLWIEELVSIGIFFTAAFFIARQLMRPGYWKMALCLVGITVINFHIGYVAWCIDYYWIEGLTPRAESPMEQLGQLVTFTGPPSEPIYQPIEVFFRPFIDLTYQQFRSDYAYIFFNFLFGTLTMPLWIAAVTYFIVRKKRKKSQGLNEPS